MEASHLCKLHTYYSFIFCIGNKKNLLETDVFKRKKMMLVGWLIGQEDQGGVVLFMIE